MKRGAFVLLVTALTPHVAHAQGAEQLLAQARQAFENIDFEQAARLFTRVLDVASGATASQRDTAQLYLGVSYEYAGQRANAVSALRSLIRSSPCTPTPEQFGSGVTAAFIEAQGGVFAVGACDVPRQEATRETGAVFRIAATRPAFVRALLADSAGRTVADLGEVDAAGVTLLRWTDLPDPSGLPQQPARHQLIIRGRAAQGTETDERSVAITLSALPADTLVSPPAPATADFRPEQRPMGPALGDLGKGIAVGVAAVAASSALAYKTLQGETVKAVAVGGAISLAGFAAFVSGSGQRTIVENRDYNAALRLGWEARRDSVVAVNRERRANRPIVIEPVETRR
ncbi:MAG: hypothetical protein HY337_10050 [Gemmatimonadetes bacterium]|nr:hypothetical protein [Gemmatimonadota bacterium]